MAPLVDTTSGILCSGTPDLVYRPAYCLLQSTLRNAGHIRNLMRKLFHALPAGDARATAAKLSIVLVLLAGCARAARQTTPARVPPSTPSRESQPVNTTTDSTRDYSGEWESGFESSILRGCNGTLPPKVWVSLAPGASEGAHWTEHNGGAPTTTTYYVRVRGILRPPQAHRPYELYVTRVLEVKPPGQPNCVIRR